MKRMNQAGRHGSRKLSRKEAAAYLGVEPGTLNKWACIGYPKLPYYRVGGKAIYDIADLDDFLATHRISGEEAEV